MKKHGHDPKARMRITIPADEAIERALKTQWPTPEWAKDHPTRGRKKAKRVKRTRTAAATR